MSVDATKLVVEWDDFEVALTEVQPKFGADTNDLASHYANGIVPYGDDYVEIKRQLDMAVHQVATSEKTPLLSVLLEGDNMTGKTAIAAHLAVNSGFPFVRMLSADALIGRSESSKCSYLQKVWMDSMKSPLSAIILDDLERIIEYTPLGPRFSNMVLQTLLVLLKKPPPPPHRLLVVGTTAIAHLLEDVQLVSIFHINVHVPKLEPKAARVLLEKNFSAVDVDAVMGHLHKPVALKQLLMVAEMSRNDDDSLDPDRFFECIHTVLGL